MVSVDQSMLAVLGGVLAPLFRPFGCGDWRIVSALLCGIGAKEATLSVLGVLFGEGTPSGIGLALSVSGILNARSALSLMVFYLFYFPCVATLVVQSRPRRLLLPLLFAYAAAVVVYWV